MYRKTLILIASLALLTTATPAVSAQPGTVCVEGEHVPDHVETCTPEQVCLASFTGCFEPTPRGVIDWVKRQIGPCTCDPQPEPM